MTQQAFFAANPVFTRSDFARHCAANDGPASASGQQAALRRAVQGRDIHRSRKGIYETSPLGKHPGETMCRFPGFVMRFAPDAVLSHYSALSYRGRGNVFSRSIVYSSSRPQPVTQEGQMILKGTLHPKALRDAGQMQFDVIEIPCGDMTLRATDWSRTLVDCMRRPDLAFGWEEIWRNYESSFVQADTKRMAEYVRLLGEPLLAAKVGFLMEDCCNRVPCSDKTLAALESMIPRTPQPMDPPRSRCNQWPSHLVKRWNLHVPENVLYKTWCQFHGCR